MRDARFASWPSRPNPRETSRSSWSGALQTPAAAERPTHSPRRLPAATTQVSQPRNPRSSRSRCRRACATTASGPTTCSRSSVLGVEQLTRTRAREQRGQVSLPLIGTLQVGGLTAQQAEALVVAKLAESYLQDPQVSLFIKEYTSQKVTVEGAVNKPGVYPLRGPTTLLQIARRSQAARAALGDMHEVMLFRTDATGRKADAGLRHRAHPRRRARATPP